MPRQGGTSRSGERVLKKHPFLTERERRLLPGALRVPQDGSKRADDARKLIGHVMQKARGAVSDLAWLALLLPPKRVMQIATVGGKDLSDMERWLMETLGKVGGEPMPAPRGRAGETVGLRALGVLQAAMWTVPDKRGGPTARVVLLSGYEPGEAIFFLPSGKFASPIRRIAPLRGHGRAKRSRTAKKDGPSVS